MKQPLLWSSTGQYVPFEEEGRRDTGSGDGPVIRGMTVHQRALTRRCFILMICGVLSTAGSDQENFLPPVFQGVNKKKPIVSLQFG
jgi:hypothetical protein